MLVAKDSFLEYARILLGLVKFTGFASFSIDNDYNASLKAIDCFFAGISFLFGLCIIGDSFRHLDLSTDEHFLINFGSIFAAYTGIIIALITMIFFFVSYNTIWNIVRTFHEIDLKVQSLGLVISHIYIFKFYLIIGVGNCFLLVPFAALMYNFNETPTNIVLYVYSGIYFSLSMGGVASCLLCIHIRLHHIIKILRNNFNVRAIRSGVECDYVAKNRVLERLNEIYRDLHFGIGETSRFFGFAGMLGIILCFLYSIYTAFIVYKSLFIGENGMKEKAIITFFWWIYIMFYPIVIISLCELIKHSTDEIIKYLKELSKYTRNEMQRYRVLSFTNLMKCCPFKFTCGLFDFDVSTAFLGVGAAFSYFIILIQFDMATQGSLKIT